MEIKEIQNELSNMGFIISSVHLGIRKDNDGWEHDAHIVTVCRNGKQFDVPYKKGLGHREKLVKGYMFQGGTIPVNKNCIAYHDAIRKMKAPVVTIDEVFYCLVMEYNCLFMPFEEWCSDYGYDEDSRKAEAIFDACRSQSEEFQRLLEPCDMDKLMDMFQEY